MTGKSYCTIHRQRWLSRRIVAGLGLLVAGLGGTLTLVSNLTSTVASMTSLWQDHFAPHAVLAADPFFNLCSDMAVLPPPIDPARDPHGAAHAFDQAGRSGLIRSEWPAVAYPNNHLNAYLNLTSLVKGNEQIQAFHTAGVTISSQAVTPKVNVVRGGGCGGGGGIIGAPLPTIRLNRTHFDRLVLTYDKVDMFAFASGSSQPYDISFLCQQAGQYTLSFRVPYSYAGQTYILKVPNAFHVVCPVSPKAVVMWDETLSGNSLTMAPVNGGS